MKAESIYWTVAKILVGLAGSGFTLVYMFSLANSSIAKYVMGSTTASREYEMNVYWTRIDHHRKMAEINQLNYILTEKGRFVDAYTKDKLAVAKNFADLKKSARPELRDELATYESMLKKKFILMDHSIALREQGREEAMQPLFMGEGRELSSNLDGLFDHSIEKLRAGLVDRIKTSTRDAAQAENLLLRTCVICGCLFLVGGGVLLNDLRKRRNYELALMAAEAKAVRSSEFKGQFLAHMSHEIRTPLNSILGMGEMLAETRLDAEQSKFISTFQRAGDSLLNIVNEILDLSKIEAGAMTFENTNFCIAGLVMDIQNLSMVRAKQKGIELKIDNHLTEHQGGQGDPGRLRQVLLNLIGNSIKFTARGSVTVRVEGFDEKWAKFSVIDTGIGMSPEAVSRMFTPFQQAEASTSRVFGGTGLGLSISKQIVERMGGKIGVESIPGQGSTFWFQVPILAKRLKSTEEARPAEVLAMPSAALKILVVDDITENRDLVQLFLRNFPYQLEFGVNGQEAVDKFKMQKFDLILIDMQMPVMGGKEAARQMREFELASGRSRTPIVAMTAEVLQDELNECFEHGCDLHVSKPIKKKILLKTVSQVIGESENAVSIKTA